VLEVGAEALELLTPKTVAGLLKVSEKTVRRLCYAGELGSVKVGKLLRIAPEDVAVYKAKLRTPAVSEVVA